MGGKHINIYTFMNDWLPHAIYKLCFSNIFWNIQKFEIPEILNFIYFKIYFEIHNLYIACGHTLTSEFVRIVQLFKLPFPFVNLLFLDFLCHNHFYIHIIFNLNHIWSLFYHANIYFYLVKDKNFKVIFLGNL